MRKKEKEREAAHVVSTYTARCCVSEQSERGEGREGERQAGEEEGAPSEGMSKTQSDGKKVRMQETVREFHSTPTVYLEMWCARAGESCSGLRSKP